MSKHDFLDDEEKQLVESYQRGEWKRVENENEMSDMLKMAAKNYMDEKRLKDAKRT